MERGLKKDKSPVDLAGEVSLDAEDSFRVLEPPKGQLEPVESILTPLKPCNL